MTGARSTALAACRPLAMHAGIPTPWYAAPATAAPGSRDTASSIAVTRWTWPTAYWGNAPAQRVTTASVGAERNPSIGPSSSRTAADDLVVGQDGGALVTEAARRGPQQDVARATELGPLRGEPGARGDETAGIRRHEKAGALERIPDAMRREPQGDQGHVGVVDRRQHGGHGGGHRLEQLRRPRRRGGDDHGVGIHDALGGVQGPTLLGFGPSRRGVVAAALETPDRRLQAYVDASRPQRLGHPLHQPRQPAAHGEEDGWLALAAGHGTARRRRRRRGGRAAQRPHEAAPAEAASSRAGNTAAALIFVVSPAWMPPMRGSTSRAVTSRPRRRRVISATGRSGPGLASRRAGPATRSTAGARHAQGRDDARPGEGPEAGRHTQGQAAREPAEPPPCPHVGDAAAGRHELVTEPELPTELHGFGTAGQEGVGPEVHGAAPDRSRAELASEALVGLEDDHVGRGERCRPAPMPR